MKPENALDCRMFDVRDADIDRARALVEEYHYAGGASNTATHLHGLFRRGGSELIGVAWWIPPTKAAALAVYPTKWQAVLALSRTVLVPDLPTNAASYLVGRSIRIIRRMDPRWECLLTYADTWRKHTGAIYRATNWESRGMTKPERIYVTEGGRMVSRKAGPKTRTHAEMLALGCTMVGSFPRHRFRMVLGPRDDRHNPQMSIPLLRAIAGTPGKETVKP